MKHRDHRKHTAPPETITPPPVVLNPTAAINGPYSGTEGQAITLSYAGSSDPYGGFHWHFDPADGSAEMSGVGQSPWTFQYTWAAGTFAPRFWVTSDTTGRTSAVLTTSASIVPAVTAVASVTVSPSPVSADKGTSVQLTASDWSGAGGTGTKLTGRLNTWASNAPTIVSVPPGPAQQVVATLANVGSAQVTCTCESKTAVVPITVNTPPAPGTGTVWFKEDFDKYADTAALLTGTANKCANGSPVFITGSGYEWNTSKITLEKSGGYGGRQNFMRYTIDEKDACYKADGVTPTGRYPTCCSNCTDPVDGVSRLRDRYYGRTFRLFNNSTNKELWAELSHRYSVGHGANNNKYGGCCPASDRKQFGWWAVPGNMGRWSLDSWVNSHMWNLSLPNGPWGGRGRNEPRSSCGINLGCSGTGWDCNFGTGGDGTVNEQCYLFPVAPDSRTYDDDQWHVWRFHWTLPPFDGAFGSARVYLNGVKILDVPSLSGHMGTNPEPFQVGFAYVNIGGNSNAGFTRAGAHEDLGHFHVFSTDPGWG